MDYDILTDEENIESEEDLHSQNAATYSKAVIWGTDWTAETIVNQLRKKNIDLNPDFQRRDAWDIPKKSKFIESLILGLPVPPIILAEKTDRKNSYLVIDGKQRLLSIMQFCADQNRDTDKDFLTLNLKNLEILKDINGYNYNTMSSSLLNSNYSNQFDNQTIRAVVIKNWPNEEFLYTVFLRLNTGSLKLSPQELRQALHPGEFLAFVNEYSEKKNPIWDIFKLKKADSRMRDIELILRYFSFKNYLNDYSDSLKDFLDNSCKKINDDWENNSEKYKDQLKELENAIIYVTEIFGEKNRFSKFIDNQYTNIFNRTIFDLMTFYFSDKNRRKELNQYKENIKQGFEKLMTDPSFVEALSGSTKDNTKTKQRFNMFDKFLESIEVLNTTFESKNIEK